MLLFHLTEWEEYYPDYSEWYASCYDVSVNKIVKRRIGSTVVKCDACHKHICYCNVNIRTPVSVKEKATELLYQFLYAQILHLETKKIERPHGVKANDRVIVTSLTHRVNGMQLAKETLPSATGVVVSCKQRHVYNHMPFRHHTIVSIRMNGGKIIDVPLSKVKLDTQPNLVKIEQEARHRATVLSNFKLMDQ